MIKLNLTCIKYFLAVVLSFAVLSASAATRYSVATGNWNANSSWSAASGGAPGASFPVAGDIVYIENGNTITVTANAACASLTFTGSGATLTVNLSMTLTLSGTISCNQLAGNSECTIAGAGSISCSNVAIGAGGTSGSNNTTFTHTLTSTISVFNIAGNLTINSYKQGQRTRNGVLSFNSGTITVGGSVTTANADADNVSTLTMSTGAQTGTLILSGATPFSLSLTGTNTISLNGTSALVNYNSAGAQTVYATSYTNLTLSGSGAKTITGATINGILSMEGTATATGSSPAFGAAATLRYLGSASRITDVEFPATFSGTGGVIINNINGVSLNSSNTINSILTLTNGAFSLGANTLTLANGSNLSYGGGSLTGGVTSNLTIGTGTNVILNAISGGLNNFNTSRNITLGADLSVNGTLTLTAGAFTVAANTLTLNGPTIAGTPTNLTTTAASNLTFGGSSAGVLIPASVTILNNLTMSNAIGVTIQGPLSIIGIVSAQNGNLSSGGFLTLISTAAQTALIDGSGAGTVSGNVTLQRYLPSGFGYKYFSSPFQAAAVGEFGDDMNLAAPLSFHRYNENRIISGFPASGWELYNNVASILAPVSGYSINFGSSSLPKTVDVTGVVNNGDISVTLYNNNQIYTKGMNLVGNPYPSPIDWTGPGWTKTNIDNALYFFKAGTTDQYGGTYSSWVNGISSDGVASNIIPSMQGFFIHVRSGSYPVTGTLTMNNNVRVTDMTQPFISKSGSKGETALLRISAGFSNDPSSEDPLVIYLDDNATPIFDSQMDAIKFFNTDYDVPNFFSSATDGSRMSVNALPYPKEEIQPIPLGIRTRINGEIIFRLEDLKGSFPASIVYLYDAITGASTDLTIEDYRITLNAGDHYTRFFLKFADISTDVHIPSGKTLYVYASGNVLFANINCLTGKEGILKVHSLTGQTMFIREIYEDGHHEFILPVVNGIYIVSFVAENIRISQKIIIQN